MSNIVIKQLFLREMKDYIEQMTQEHWDEVPFGDFDLDLDVEWDTFISLDGQGLACCLFAFDDDKPVGYLVLLCSGMMHHKGTTQAVTDVFYVDPAYRSSGVFQQLLDEAKRQCAQGGIRFFSVNVNPQFVGYENLLAWLQQTGYQCTEISMTTEV